ncbi:MAG: hypothetical protein ABEH56_08660 [Salinirussus sp.]
MTDGPEEPGEVTLTRTPLRFGGWIGYDDEAIYVDRDDDEKLKIRHPNVIGIVLNGYQWDLIVMSALLVGVGAFVAATRNPPVGVVFGAVGVASVYWTYRKRYELVIRVENAKPVSVYPTEPVECHERLAALIERSEPGT